MSIIEAGPPLEPPRGPVGRTSTVLIDESRDDRALPIDCWYPAAEGSAGERAASVYELLPGVGFTASAQADPPAAPGAHPFVIWSHGRSGTRSSYSMLCEGLAARGYIVVAPDHPGDTLVDWLLNVAADDPTNEANRVADVRYVLDAALRARPGLQLAAEIDTERIAVAGHSYGGYTALAVAGAERPDPRVRAIAGLQSFTRTLPPTVFARVKVPTLLMAGARDTATPPATDADPAFAALAGARVTRVDVADAGHQASSDVGLYLELAPSVEGLPELVSDYLQTLADQITGRAGDPWRPTVGLHLRTLRAWLDEAFDRDPGAARSDLDAVRDTPGVTVRRGAQLSPVDRGESA